MNTTNITDSVQTCRSCFPFVRSFQEAKRLIIPLLRQYVSYVECVDLDLDLINPECVICD